MENHYALCILVRTSLIALFASFVPELAGELTADEQIIWRSSCAILGLAILGDVSWALSRPIALRHGQRLTGYLAFAVVAGLLSSAAGFLPPASFVFLVGLLFMLVVALVNFVALLITGTQPVPGSRQK